jgi:hypothetical protein
MDKYKVIKIVRVLLDLEHECMLLEGEICAFG